MSDSSRPLAGEYINPVYSKSFPDPFVLKFRGQYYAYCTGFAPNGNVFGVLHSRDLVCWTEVGGAMEPLETSPPYYWAPEVFYDNGKFYLYYSAGNEVLMEIRVAVSDRPDGGFLDSGRRLTNEEFAIDAHVFVDDDGSRHLFYATDFLTHTHIGTGTVVDRMLDNFTLEGKPRPVTRARFDWQVYDPQRKEKGGVRWHTVEGPAVLKRKGVYYEMFSGGNWQNTTYGVSFAVTDDLNDPAEWLQFSDGKKVLPILRTIPDKIIGPGHNSVVRGPNNRELFCVYHRWIDGHRVMAIDRMDFAARRIFVLGATDTPQPAPFQPSIRERFTHANLADGLSATGRWQFTADGALTDPASRCELSIEDVPESFLMELTWSMHEPHESSARFGVILKSGDLAHRISFDRENETFEIRSGDEMHVSDLPGDFAWSAEHLLRIEVDYRLLKVRVDDARPGVRLYLDRQITGSTIFSDRESVRLSSLELTDGFEELFEDQNAPTENGWSMTGGEWTLEQGELFLTSDGEYCLEKGVARADFEFAANLRTLDPQPASGELGLRLEDGSAEVFRLSIDCRESAIAIGRPVVSSSPISERADLSQYHQLRIIRTGAKTLCYFDDLSLGEFPLTATPVRPIVFAAGVPTAIEMIRVTSI